MLQFGDYSCLGLEGTFAVERKSLYDFVSSVTVGYDRIMRNEVAKAKSTGAQLIFLVEASRDLILRVEYDQRSEQVGPQQILGAERALAMLGIPTIWAGSREGARAECEAMLRRAWEKRTKCRAAVS